jgi:RNA polymerase sigma-70 factor (ECF subfamily)
VGPPFFRALTDSAGSYRVAESILTRIAAGDSPAVDECLQQYGGLVWSLARRFCPDHAEAEDAVQEVFVDVWKSAARFDEKVGSEATFITMIARRRLIDRHRKRTRQIDTALLVEEALPGEEEGRDRVEFAEDVAQARQALDQLRTEERRVLELSIYEGLSQSKIAEATDMPLGTVKTHARRGLIRLREMLSPDATAQAGRVPR